jgi:outer membrane murein-binding lipoprotein Lpp
MQQAMCGLRNQEQQIMNAISQLRDEAEQADDYMQVALCELALRGCVSSDTMDELSGDDRNLLATHYGVSRDGTTQYICAQDKAEAECRSTIESAHAQD